MRYLDWDVLLFPHGQDPIPAPLKEFSTACYLESYDTAGNPTPLLTTFIPSLPPGSHFQISIHSWVNTGPMFAATMNSTAVRELWQAKIVIDGTCVCTENLPIDAKWPQVVKEAPVAGSGTGRETVHLSFPPFHRNIMSQNHWDAADQMGRIRVELTAGYVEEHSNRFVKMQNTINFSFQHSPLSESIVPPFFPHPKAY